MRFSLRGFILGVGFLCLLAANVAALRDIPRLRSENRRLRDELGYLTVEDPERLHLISVPRYEDLRWQWRIYVPRRDQFRVVVEWDEFLGDETIHRRAQAPLSPGEFPLELAIYRSSRGDWKLLIHGIETSISRATVLDLQQRSFSRPLGRAGTFTPEPFDRLPLLEQFDPEATLFGGAEGAPAANLQVFLVDTRQAQRRP
ncbi:MAG: hypothetical protein KY475_26415 [Planctomycetes bacterium]|nr:hypothetical protein [Planctomycetota bacterium]